MTRPFQWNFTPLAAIAVAIACDTSPSRNGKQHIAAIDEMDLRAQRSKRACVFAADYATAHDGELFR